MKIVILDGYGVNPGDLSWDFLNEFADVDVYDHEMTEKTVERLLDADIAITNKVVIDRDIISQLPKLKLIVVAATGYNVVDVKAAREYGVLVANIPAYSTDSVAQMVFAHILNITNRVQHYANENRNGRWCKSEDFCYYDFTTHELAGMTLGIIGVGNIGAKVAAIANCFGMNVIAKTHRSQDSLPCGIKKVGFEELLKESDFISLHCPLTEESKEIICKENIEKMKKGVVLINTGRGGLINEQDVADGLKSGQIGAFATDVLTHEPALESCPLLSAPNSYLTPHIAWASFEARKRLMNILRDNIKGFLEGKPVNIVN